MATPAGRHHVAVLDTRANGYGSFVVRLQRPDGFRFLPGHHLRVGLPGDDNREYSICSGADDPFLEILVRHVPTGRVSPQLQACAAGDILVVEGPSGDFLLPLDFATHRYMFVATGTGVAPFRSILRTHPELDYQLLHGLRSLEERMDMDVAQPARTTLCLSRQKPVPETTPEGIACRAGRVTQLLREAPPSPDTECYICGSCDMIYEVVAILTEAGVPRSRLHAETYY